MTRNERLEAIRAVAKRNRKRRAMSGNTTASQARAEVIARVEKMDLPPLPRRSDTKPINWAAIHEVECQDCGLVWHCEQSATMAYKLCKACRKTLSAPGRTEQAQAAWRDRLLSLVTDEWQSTRQLAAAMGPGDYSGSFGQKVRDTLTRAADRGLIEGCYRRVSSRGRSARCYRRVQDAD